VKIFLTGASGYVGGAVAQKLKSKGNYVIALARNNESAIQLEELGYTVIKGDMLSPQNWQSQAAEADTFIHCAQLRFGKRVGMSWVDKAAAADQAAWRGIITAAKQSKNCKAIIYTSGISVVGDYNGQWTDESTTPKPSQTVGSYHLQGEQLAREALRDGLPVIIIRPSLPVSSGGTFASFFLSQAEKGKLQLVGDGKNYWPTIHLEDLVNAYALALEVRPIGETIIVSDDNPLTMKEFSNTLLHQFGKGKAKSAPKWLVSLFAGAPIANLLVSSFRVRNHKAKKILGWNPQYPTFYEALKEMMSSYRPK
jgi:nucleoside-diphosphate-sugar epimerase